MELNSIDLLETNLEAFSTAQVRCPSPAVERKAFQPFQVGARAQSDEFQEMDQAINRNRVDGMLDAAGVCLSLLRIELQSGDEEFSQSIVATQNVLRHMTSFNRERDMAVGAVIDKPPTGQRLQGSRHRSALYFHLSCDLFGASHPMRFFQMEDHLEVIFQACRQSFDDLRTRILASVSNRLFHGTDPTSQAACSRPGSSLPGSKKTRPATSPMGKLAKLAPPSSPPGLIHWSHWSQAFLGRQDEPCFMAKVGFEQQGTICTMQGLLAGADCSES